MTVAITETGHGTDEALTVQGHAAAHHRFMTRSVAVIGFMGVGKTSVGTAAAELLGRPFVDTDHMVEEEAGRSIPEIFAEGEPVFRALERAALEVALGGPQSVIALGGGAFGQPGAAELLLSKAIVVHLYTPWRVLLDQIPELSRTRPLLRDRPVWEVQDLFLARARTYRRAHVRICLQRQGVAQAAQAVASLLQARHR